MKRMNLSAGASFLCGLIVASFVAYLVTTNSQPNYVSTDLNTSNVVPTVAVPPTTSFGASHSLHRSRLDEVVTTRGLCSETCGYCTSCADDATYEWDLVSASAGKGSCAWLTKNSLREDARKARYCTDSFMDGVVKYRCAASCGTC